MVEYKGHRYRNKGKLYEGMVPIRFQTLILLTQEEYDNLPNGREQLKFYKGGQMFKEDFRPLYETDMYQINLLKL